MIGAVCVQQISTRYVTPAHQIYVATLQLLCTQQKREI